MSRLERNSRARCRCRHLAQQSQAWRTLHGSGEVLPRHLHDHAFAALVLSGRYVEAGDAGRHALESGDVLIHAAYESHIDRIAAGGAEVLVIPLGRPWTRPILGRLSDPDAVVRLAETDTRHAIDRLEANWVARQMAYNDWPSLLADDLNRQPDLCLQRWADLRCLHQGSLSRGFRQEFGVTPAHFRVLAKMHKALRLLRDTHQTLSSAACVSGFADQSHMTRILKREIAATPLQFRKQAKYPRAASR